MNSNDKPQRESPPAAPTESSPGCLHIYWVLRSQEGGLLHCSLHQMERIYEVRMAHGLQPPVRVQRASTTAVAARYAERFKRLALSHGYHEPDRTGQ